MAEGSSSGKFFTLLLAAITASATYAFIGTNSSYAYLMFGKTLLVALLGLSGKIKSWVANVALLIFLIFGVGSSILGQTLDATLILGAKSLSLITFVFIAISAIGTILKILFGLVGLVLLVLAIGYVMDNQQLEKTADTSEHLKVDEIPKNSDQDIKSEEKPDDILRSHERNWRDLKFKPYAAKLEVWASDYQSSKENREKIKVRKARTSQEYWRQIYQNLIKNDMLHLDKVLETFIAIGKSKNLNQMEFARMVVSCVQDIPYVLIYTESCQDLAKESPDLQALAEKHSCKGPVKYGLQSPTEFMYNLEGDCDTRTVFLFTVLSRLGYKVCILNSDVYGHSMFGISIPAKGDYKDFRGNHYYFWETTAKGWDVGVLPPEMGQVQHWDVILAN